MNDYKVHQYDVGVVAILINHKWDYLPIRPKIVKHLYVYVRGCEMRPRGAFPPFLASPLVSVDEHAMFSRQCSTYLSLHLSLNSRYSVQIKGELNPKGYDEKRRGQSLNKGYPLASRAI